MENTSRPGKGSSSWEKAPNFNSYFTLPIDFSSPWFVFSHASHSKQSEGHPLERVFVIRRTFVKRAFIMLLFLSLEEHLLFHY